MSSKIFILDTNVILHDHNCIYNFEEHDVVIPITVLEELDNFKRGNSQLNYQAREFARLLDQIISNGNKNGEVDMGDGRGKLILDYKTDNHLSKYFQKDIPDHRILASANKFKEEQPDREVILVTKDINLRMKARSIGVHSEDYKNDKIEDSSSLINKKSGTIETTSEVIDKIYETGSIPTAEVELNIEVKPNEGYILTSTENKALVKYHEPSRKLVRVDKINAYGIKPRNMEQTFFVDALMSKNVDLLAATGKAGTGKTLLALAAAIAQHDEYDQIILARPIVSLSNKDIGFLPGDATEKVQPYMQPLFDNLSVIKSCHNQRSMEYQKIENLFQEKRLNIEALAFIRGRSLSNTFFIIDEAQNLTPHEVKTVITRAGEHTKIVFTGDIEQIDSPYLDIGSNGLAFLIEKMQGQSIFCHINLQKGERSYLAELASNIL